MNTKNTKVSLLIYKINANLRTDLGVYFHNTYIQDGAYHEL